MSTLPASPSIAFPVPPSVKEEIRTGACSLMVQISEPLPQVALVALEGELEIRTAPLLEKLLVDCSTRGLVHLLVDAALLSYIDSNGLRVVIDALRRARPVGGTMALVSPTRVVQRVFAITGLDRLIAIHSDLDAALAALSQG